MDAHKTKISSSGEKLIGPGLIAFAFVIMARWSWLTWPDILIDFGRELYIPWQLSTGKALYTDIAYYSGPLSPYLNAMWFKLFGVGLSTLVWCNLAILAAFVALLYTFVLNISERLTATIASLAFVFLFAFAQYTPINNYNYVCPYSHDAIHGMMLSLLALFLAGRFLTHRSITWLILCGLALGLAFLTRAEVFLPGAVSVLVLLGLDCWFKRGRRQATLLRAAILPACAIIPPLIAFLLLARRMPASMALNGTLGTWPAMLKGQATAMPYFRSIMGTDHLQQSLTILARCLIVYALVVASFLILSWLTAKAQTGQQSIAATILMVTLIAFAILCYGPRTPWNSLRAMPAAMLIAGILSFLAIIRSTTETPSVSSLLRIAIAVFAFIAMGKIILNTHMQHYGFVMAMPAVIVSIVALLNWLPQWCDRKWRGGQPFRMASLGLIAAYVFTFLSIQSGAFASKRDEYVIHRGVDTFRSDRRAAPIKQALKVIDDLVGPKETIVALPEGVMLNYLTRRVNSTPHTNWMPTEFVIFGEENMFRSLREHPPDWIVLVHKDTSEFGVRFFGTDYGREIMDWVRFNYVEVGTILERPLVTEHHFGVQFLRKK